MRTGMVLCASLMAALATGARAQKTQGVLTAVKADTVFLFLAETPRVGQAYYVERKGPGDKEFVRLTTEPLRATTSAAEATAALGPEYESLAKTLEATSADDLLLKLRADRFTSMVYTLISHRVGVALGRFFAAGGHRKGAKYAYRLVFVDREGATVQMVETSVTVKERQPAPPTKVAATQEGRSVVLTWQYPKWQQGTGDMVVQFYVYRKSDRGKLQRVSGRILTRLEGVVLRFVDEQAVEGTEYTYHMTAVDAAGVESKPSEKADVLVRDFTPPGAPAGLAALAGEKAIELIWNENAELDVAGYHVYRWTGLAKDSVRLTRQALPAADPHWVDSSSATGSQYYYAVSAVDRSGNEGPHGTRISAFPTDSTVPSPPKGLTAKVDGGSVRLQWERSADRDILGYRVLRGVSAGKQTYVTPEPADTTAFVDKGGKDALEPGRRYYYAVVAFDSVWHQSEKVTVSVRIPDTRAPDRPGAVSVENEYGRGVRVRWNESPSLDVARYRLSRNQGSTSVVLDTCPADERQWYDTSARAMQTYVYEVTAEDSSGNVSPATASTQVTVKDFTGPPRPRFAAATLAQSGVRVYWERVVDYDLAGYNVYRSNLPTGVFVKVNEKPLTALELIDPKGSKSTWYRVKAVDTAGNEGQASDPVEAVGQGG